MKTEILIPFNFDTTLIESMMQEHGVDEAMKILERIVKENVISKLPKRPVGYGYNNGKEPDWRGLMEDTFHKWLDEHSQEIVDEAALLLAARAGRKKAWREVLAEVKEESNG